MAHAAALTALTDELVESIVSHHPVRHDAQAFVKACKEAALRNLRYHRFGRTNQFNVQKSLDGLVEKFQVLNNDPLASALDVRLKKLAAVESKWTPEILSLFLLLSENPAANSRIENLDKLKPEDSPPQLTWAAIFGDEPHDGDALWHDEADDASESSDDFVILTSQTPPHLSQQGSFSTSVADDDDVSHAESLVVKVDTTALDSIENKAARRITLSSGVNKRITELQATRQVLYMLRGLPSMLFETDKSVGRLKPANNYCIDHLSGIAFTDLLSAFSDLGSDLSVLRRFMTRRVTSPLLGAFACAIEKEIRDVDGTITEIEKLYTDGKGQIVVSLLNVHARIRDQLRHLSALKDIVTRATSLNEGHTYSLLDDLYTHICEAQATGDEASFGNFVAIFLACLNTYLRPILQWMLSGRLEDSLELITSAEDAAIDPAMFWQQKFSIVSHKGHPASPQFLSPFVSHIFSAGKSVAFMKELGITFQQPRDIETSDLRLKLDLAKGGDKAIDLLPFSVLLNQSLQDWVRTKHQLTSLSLCEHLLYRASVWKTINALEYLYLSHDGVIFETLAHGIFSRFDSGKESWNDTYAIESIAQQVLEAVDFIDPACISVKKAASTRQWHARTVTSLSSFILDYSFSWPVQNIIPGASLATYQNVFTFLIQIYRASSLLSQHRFRTINIIRPKSTSHSDPAHTLNPDPKSQARVKTVAQHLHHRLLHLMSTLQNYITQTAIHLSCLTLHSALSEARDVDAMVAAHASFIRSLERRCLNAKEVENARNALLRLLDLVCAFTDLVAALARGSAVDKEHNEGPVPNDAPDSDSGSEEGVSAVTQKNGKSDARTQVETMEPETVLTRLQQLKTQYMHLLSIVVAGLRSARREQGGEEAWEELCESLEWSMRR